MYMEGRFLRKKSASVWRIIIALCGVLIIGLFFFILVVDPEIRESREGIRTASILILFGGLDILLSILAYLFNRHAYLHLCGEHISARYSWNNKLFCYYSEIAWVAYSPTTLTIMLKSGKMRNIYNLANAAAICRAIRKQIYRPMQDGLDVVKMRRELVREQKKLKKELWVLVAICLFVSLNLLFSIFWTDGKDISAFSPVERGFFILFTVTEVAAVLVLFIWTGFTGKNEKQFKRRKDALRRAVLMTTPVLPGNLTGCYIDGNNRFRITLYGFPNSEQVYYCQENVNSEYQLKSVYQSEIFENEEELLPLTDLLIRVPEPPSSEE